MSKTLKIAIAAVAVAVLIIASVVMFMFLPRSGKKSTDTWNGVDSYVDGNTAVINKVAGEDLRILQLTDLQFTTVLSSKKLTKDTVTKLIEENKPHLILLTGDNVAGLTSHFNVNFIIDMMDSFKIPWAPVFGNHDRELSGNLYYQSQQYEKSEYCLFSQGPSNIHGVGNYVINIKEGNKFIYSIFMMDSNGNRDYEIDGKKFNGYDYIYPDQIEWYEDNIKAIEKLAGHTVPSMTFFHIALPEFTTAYDLYEAKSPEVELLHGERREGECPPPENTHFFDKMVELGSTTHVMIGHDHVNDYAIKYKGIVLGYGVKTGNHSYYDKEINGGTVLTINDDGVKLENKYILY